MPHALTLSLKEHTAIAQAIRRGNPEAAEKAMQAHLGAALKRYEDAMEKHMPARERNTKSESAR